MTTMNCILLFIGILNLFLGVLWNKKNWYDVLFKILILFSGVFCMYYALFLNGYILVLNK